MGIWSVMCYLLLFSLVILFTEEKKPFTKRDRFPEQLDGLQLTEEEKLILQKLEGVPRTRRDYSAEVNEFTMLSDLETN